MESTATTGGPLVDAVSRAPPPWLVTDETSSLLLSFLLLRDSLFKDLETRWEPDFRATLADRPTLATCLRSRLVASTEMMGATEAAVRMPKPSAAPVALEKPMPSASTKGTVTGPVVTPALSHAMLVKSSLLKQVIVDAMAYLIRMMATTGTPNKILVAPTAIPTPTPKATAQTSIDAVNWPPLRCSTVRPSTSSAGSARVARMPSTNTMTSTRKMPPT
mmetsp:Transcript_13672/g.33640  ORF Transcript_13672/g.33640 Transcript_13672/m.33640 type:complete len:219 (-) Transcript_13672:1907-2563(-)